MQEYLDLLKEFVAFKSISTDPQYDDEINATAQWLSRLLSTNGFETEVIEGYGHPIFYASYQTDPNAETVLIYGHYDVQPANKENGWTEYPFTLSERNGKLYARGVVDNKGQILIYLHTVLQLITQNNLAYNVKFLIEGDEETGGEGISALLQEQADKFRCDFCLISDGEMPYRPVITASFRGITNLTITYKTANNNLHSGLFGGAVPNAAQELATLISKCYDTDYIPQIPHFYENQIQMTDEEQRLAKEADPFKKAAIDHTGVKKLFVTETGSFNAKIGFYTMLTVTGFKSGYIQNGYSNIVPNTAEAKINFRIAAGQDPQWVYDNFVDFVMNNTPEYVDVSLTTPVNAADAIKVDISTEKHKEAIALLEKIYGEKPLMDYCGAIIPVVGDIQQYLDVEPILISLANDDCNMHGVDENYDKKLLEKGLVFAETFLSH